MANRLSRLAGRVDDFNSRLLQDYGPAQNPTVAGGPPPAGQKLAIFMMGLPASGKTTLVNRRYAGAGYVVIDPDEIAKGLPGYDPDDPQKTHERAKEIARQMFEGAIAAGQNFVVDGTATDPVKLKARMKLAKEAGYWVHLLYVTVPLETSLLRNRMRRRHVPEGVIMQKAEEVESSFKTVRSSFDSIEVFDNSDRGEGDRVPVGAEAPEMVSARNPSLTAPLPKEAKRFLVETKLVRSRVYKASEAPTFTDAGDVAKFARRIEGSDRERLLAFYTDIKKKLVGIQQVSVGGTAVTTVPPESIARMALHVGAAGVFIAHNHPSGNETPSEQDIGVSEKLHQALGFLNIEFVDHVVIGSDGKYASIRRLERGPWANRKNPGEGRGDIKYPDLEDEVKPEVITEAAATSANPISHHPMSTSGLVAIATYRKTPLYKLPDGRVGLFLGPFYSWFVPGKGRGKFDKHLRGWVPSKFGRSTEVLPQGAVEIRPEDLPDPTITTVKNPAPRIHQISQFSASLFDPEISPAAPSRRNPEAGPLFGVQDDTQEKKIKKALDRIEEEAVKVLESDGAFKKWLRTTARFHHYSFGNQLLIQMQRPSSTIVAGFNKWKDLGRNVKAGEKGIGILAPVRYRAKLSEEQVTAIREKSKAEGKSDYEIEKDLDKAREVGQAVRFVVVYVFDVEQTEGKPLVGGSAASQFKELEGEAATGLLLRLRAVAESKGITVTQDPALAPGGDVRGFWRPDGNTIWLKPGRSVDGTARTLLHELTHARLHQPHGFEYAGRRGEAETQAEAVAYAVGQHYGLDTGASSFPYIAGWAQDKENIRKYMSDLVGHIAAMVAEIGEVPVHAEVKAGGDDAPTPPPPAPLPAPVPETVAPAIVAPGVPSAPERVAVAADEMPYFWEQHKAEALTKFSPKPPEIRDGGWPLIQIAYNMGEIPQSAEGISGLISGSWNNQKSWYEDHKQYTHDKGVQMVKRALDNDRLLTSSIAAELQKRHIGAASAADAMPARNPYVPTFGPTPDAPGLLGQIRHGDRVTIVDRFGKESTGRAVMRSDPRYGPGWVLNMGGKHGTPGIATEANIIRVSKAGAKRNPEEKLKSYALDPAIQGKPSDPEFSSLVSSVERDLRTKRVSQWGTYKTSKPSEGGTTTVQFRLRLPEMAKIERYIEIDNASRIVREAVREVSEKARREHQTKQESAQIPSPEYRRKLPLVSSRLSEEDSEAVAQAARQHLGKNVILSGGGGAPHAVWRLKGVTVDSDASLTKVRVTLVPVDDVAKDMFPGRDESTLTLGSWVIAPTELAKNPEKEEVKPWMLGYRVQLHPGTDAWARGDRYGEVVKLGRRHLHVKMDKSGRTLRAPPELVTWEERAVRNPDFKPGDAVVIDADMRWPGTRPETWYVMTDAKRAEYAAWPGSGGPENIKNLVVISKLSPDHPAPFHEGARAILPFRLTKAS